MKKIMKILSITLILCMVIANFCFAAVTVPDPDTGGGLGSMEGFAKKILGTLQTVGIFIAVGMAIFLGIKYVAASPEGKSELKKQLGVYVLGIVLILGATAIVTALANIVESAPNS